MKYNPFIGRNISKIVQENNFVLLDDTLFDEVADDILTQCNLYANYNNRSPIYTLVRQLGDELYVRLPAERLNPSKRRIESFPPGIELSYPLEYYTWPFLKSIEKNTSFHMEQMTLNFLEINLITEFEYYLQIGVRGSIP